MSSRIAYFINQYPKVSHSFIRREIQALERHGFDILRIALRGWDGEAVDDHDTQERAQTRYVLQRGLPALLLATLRMIIASPGRFTRALALAIRMGRRSDRPLSYHLVYLAEACRILPWLKTFGATHLHAHFGTNSTAVAMLCRVLGGPTYSFTAHGPEEFDKPMAIRLDEKINHAAFVVGPGTAGIRQGQKFKKHGIRASHTAEVILEDCRVPGSWLLGGRRHQL